MTADEPSAVLTESQFRDVRRRRDVRVFLASGVMWQLVTDAYWLLLFVRVVTDLRLHPAQLLLLGTAKEVAVLVSEVPTGVVADVISRKRSVWVAFVISGTGIVLAGFATAFWPMVVAQLVWGCGSTFRSGAETAWITDELQGDGLDDRVVGDVLLRRSQWAMGAGIAGVALAGLLAVVGSLGWALTGIGTLAAAWGAVLVGAMPERHFAPVAAVGRERYLTTWRQARVVLRGAPALRWQLGAVVIAGCASEAIDRLHVRRLAEIGFPTGIDEVVLVGALGIADLLLGIGLVHTIRRRLGGQQTAVVAAALLACTAVGVATVGAAPLFAAAAGGLVLQGGTRAATSTAHLIWTNNFAPAASRATVHSFAGQAQSLGEITGGALFGVVIATSTLTIGLLGSAALYLCAAGTANIGARFWRRTET